MVSDKKPSKQAQPTNSTNTNTPPVQTTDTASNTSSITHQQNLVVPSRQREGTPTGSTNRDGTPPAGRSRSPTPTRRSGSGDPSRYSIDPAVVRAVDRKRTIADSVREGIYK